MMYRILDRLSGGDAVLFRYLVEVSLCTALGPQTLRSLDSLPNAPAPHVLMRLRDECDGVLAYQLRLQSLCVESLVYNLSRESK